MANYSGRLLYNMYRALTYGVSPFIYLHLQFRKLRGLEHPVRWTERLGRPSLLRPPGPLIWFHAVSLGEGMVAIPLIKCCIERRPDVNILMTTTTLSAFEVIKNKLPTGVMYQFAPLDIPASMDSFLGYWKPDAIVLMENELWPNLIMGASRHGITVALLNARMSMKSFNKWSFPLVLPLASLMLSKFSIIAPLSMVQGIQFQLLHAPPFIIRYSGDLKYATEAFDLSNIDKESIEDLRLQLAGRRVWVASSLHKGEEELMIGVHEVLKQVHPDVVRVHEVLKQVHPDVVTVIVPRHPEHGLKIAVELQKEGVSVALRSRKDKLEPGTNIYVLDTLGKEMPLSRWFQLVCVGELSYLYRLAPIAVIGGSFLPDMTGHNISEAAAAGCAVLTGRHVGHFAHMVQEMQQLNPLSVMQVSGKHELQTVLCELFSDKTILEARRRAAREAFHALSNGVAKNVWDMLHYHVLRKALRKG